MKLVLLGNPHLKNSWKQHVAKDGLVLGWNIIHLSTDISADEVVHACEDADILLWIYAYKSQIRGDTLRMLRRVEAGGCITVSMHQDLYWGIPYREKLIKEHPFWRAQYVFTPDGGHQEKFFELGINHFWLPPAVGTASVFRGMPQRKFSRQDIVFVGDCNPTIHKNHRAAMLNWVRRKYRHKFAWYGTRRYGRYVYGDDLNSLFASTKIVIGDAATPSGDQCSKYWSDRLPITMGRGGMMVHTEVEGMASQGFVDEVTLRTFPYGDFNRLGQVIDSLLDDEEEREKLIQAGMNNILENHTWAHRLQTIADTVKDNHAQDSSSSTRNGMALERQENRQAI